MVTGAEGHTGLNHKVTRLGLPRRSHCKPFRHDNTHALRSPRLRPVFLLDGRPLSWPETWNPALKVIDCSESLLLAVGLPPYTQQRPLRKSRRRTLVPWLPRSRGFAGSEIFMHADCSRLEQCSTDGPDHAPRHVQLELNPTQCRCGLGAGGVSGKALPALCAATSLATAFGPPVTMTHSSP